MKIEKQVTSGQLDFTFSRRAIFVGGVQAAIGATVAARMSYIAVADNEKYKLLAESNRVNLTIIPPRRGWFIDRNGKPIATNRADFRVDIIPDRLVRKDETIATLANLLALSSDDVDRIHRELQLAQGFQPVQVADGLDYERFAAVSVRLPDLPGVSPRQGYSRFYPSGAAVGHLVGYVGTVSAEEYQKNKNPLLITPGFKVGKDGLEKTLEAKLQGEPGAKRSEVTARGKIIRELTTRPDTPGKSVQLTIDIDLHNFAARRLGLESGSVVVFDCLTGDILTMASMPCYDPNSFSDGIGRIEWKMLNSDDHIPMLNKALQGLYPPGSTLKPMAALALLKNGVDPDETVFCAGGYRLGNRVFKCLGRHGTMNMTSAIMKSCNTYFYSMGRRIGYDKIAPIARELGLGQEFPLPFPSQRYGTVPDSEWKQRKLGQAWTESDTLNAVIGQGYIIASPFQLGLMAARIASGLNIHPQILKSNRAAPSLLSFPTEHLDIVRNGMNLVVNGAGTAVRSRLPLENIMMAGKTGTAQVRRIAGAQRGQSGAWKYRDHGLFICFAPVDNPRYGAAVVIEHGMGGARAAAPIAKDVLTFIYDRELAMKSLEALEAGWGGNIEQRLAAKYAAFQGQPAEPPPLDPTA
ncbi:penicillin-binding protein 2 [Sphingorhabdus sp. IMCC26285]|jgi:penicillin-binding protein 2|uniref:Penicillin-binding protein 2 n=1 Tax=Sphingorhabdus profundilacus TaxID=2509718 RepID=A0A6I4LS88_9SPHN|nr:penicillin-binding protein 2 [Sphingorhabdus profundilacus]MVZ96282.1 penicillin-binding protein 2 [Sphingorhabdus profundilacus]